MVQGVWVCSLISSRGVTPSPPVSFEGGPFALVTNLGILRFMPESNKVNTVFYCKSLPQVIEQSLLPLFFWGGGKLPKRWWVDFDLSGGTQLLV